MCMPTDRPRLQHRQFSFRHYRGRVAPDRVPILDERQAFWIFIKLFFFLLQQQNNNFNGNGSTTTPDNGNDTRQPDICHMARVLVTECTYRNRMGSSPENHNNNNNNNNNDHHHRHSDLPTQVARQLRELVGESYWIHSRNYFERYCIRRGIRHARVTALYQIVPCNHPNQDCHDTFYF